MDIEKLEKLNELREKGILTQEEFDIEKKKLLNLDMKAPKQKEKNDNQTDKDENKTPKKKFGFLKAIGLMITALIGFSAVLNLSNEVKKNTTEMVKSTPDELLNILAHYEQSAEEIFYENGYSEYDEMMKKWWQNASVKDISNLLDKGLDINKKYQGNATLFSFACRYASTPDIIDILIKRGAEVNLDNALLQASERNNANIVEHLIKLGANVNYKEGWTPLMMAARWNSNPDIIDVLVHNGADVNAKDDGEETALQLAVYGNSNIQVAETLIKNGAKLNYDLLNWAQENSEEMVNFIREHLRKLPLSPDEDCTQAVEEAYRHRMDIYNGELFVYAQMGEEGVTPKKQIKVLQGVNYKVTDFFDDGIIITRDCEAERNAGIFIGGGFGALVAGSCVETKHFIYTKNTDYATGERFGRKNLFYKEAGVRKFKNIFGKVVSIEAFEEIDRNRAEIDYKTYLRNKNLKCCNTKDPNKFISCK